MTARNSLPKLGLQKRFKRYSTLDPTQKIIVQAQTKLTTFRWYREEKITPKMQKKKTNQWMPQRRTTSEMQKNMNEWIQKLRDLLHERKERIKEKAHLLNPVLNSLRGK